MTTTSAAATRRDRAVDRLVLAMLRTRHGRYVLPGLTALRFTARRSGQVVMLPVAYAATGADVTVLVGRAAGKRWWRNFRGGHPVEVLLAGQWRAGTGEVVARDRLEYPRLLAGYRARHRMVSGGTVDPIVHIRLR